MQSQLLPMRATPYYTYTNIRIFDKLIDKHNRLRCTNNKFPILVCPIHFSFKKNVQDLEILTKMSIDLTFAIKLYLLISNRYINESLNFYVFQIKRSSFNAKRFYHSHLADP